MPHVTVGGFPETVSWAEYALALMRKGTLVEFDKKACMFGGPAKRGRGTFVGSMFYDGVSGRVDVEVDDTGRRESVDIFPAFGDRIRRVKP